MITFVSICCLFPCTAFRARNTLGLCMPVNIFYTLHCTDMRWIQIYDVTTVCTGCARIPPSPDCSRRLDRNHRIDGYPRQLTMASHEFTLPHIIELNT